jgi:hypothetical protein
LQNCEFDQLDQKKLEVEPEEEVGSDESSPYIFQNEMGKTIKEIRDN